MTDNTVEFDAIVNKCQTLADQGLRVSFDLQEDAIVPVAWLMEAKRSGVVLRVTIAAKAKS